MSDPLRKQAQTTVNIAVLQTRTERSYFWSDFGTLRQDPSQLRVVHLMLHRTQPWAAINRRLKQLNLSKSQMTVAV